MAVDDAGVLCATGRIVPDEDFEQQRAFLVTADTDTGAPGWSWISEQTGVDADGGGVLGNGSYAVSVKDSTVEPSVSRLLAFNADGEQTLTLPLPVGDHPAGVRTVAANDDGTTLLIVTADLSRVHALSL